MKQSRRHFLQTAALGAAALTVESWPQPTPARLRPVETGTARGLLFDESDVERIRQTIRHPRFAPFWNSIAQADLEEDGKFLRDELRLNNHVADMLRARQILERTSFAYAVTKDQRQLEVAKIAASRILDYRRWDYFLEAGKHTIGLQRAPEATIAMSLAREWLDDALTDEVKREMEVQIAEKGAPACYLTLFGMRYPDRVRGWGFDPEDDYPFRFDLSRWPFILNSTNLKVIPIAGLGIAACLLYGKHPQAQRWLDMALQSARAFAPMFGSDGSYDEGVSYWGYTALHLTLFLEVLHRRLGIDERGLINYPGTVRYGLQMSMPTVVKPEDCVNFGDASVVGDVSVAAWVARKHRDPIAQYVAENVGAIRSHFALVWYDPSVRSGTPGADLFDVRFVNDIVVSRTGWDLESSAVALRSGGPANHEHADRNSVIFKAYGERLLHDPFKAAYSHTLPHWVLRQTEAHTAVLINGKGHQYHDGREGTNASWAEARILAYSTAPDRVIVTSDATEAYRLVDPDVDLVHRTLVFLKPDVLLIFDRVRMKSAPATVQLRYQIFNEDGEGKSRVEKSGFEIRRPNSSLRAVLAAPSALKIRSGTHRVPEEIGIYPYVEVESGTSTDHKVLTVCTAQRAGKPHGKPRVTALGTHWTVKVEHNGQRRTVTIAVDEDLPEVVVT